MSDRDDKVVSFDRPRGAPPDRLREFLETARRIKEERAAAVDVVNDVLRATPVEAWPGLAARPELQNNGALERLGNESRERLDRKPLEALALAELATTIADALPEDSYPAVVLAQIRAGAWKDRANALRYVGRHEEAFDAISRAEKTLMGHAALVVDRAVVDLVKATVLYETGSYAAAHEHLASAEAIFSDCGDLQRLRYARVIRGNALYNEGRYADALAGYREALRDAERANDSESVARLHNNIGYCATHLGDFGRANIHFSDAIAKFSDLGFSAEAARTMRGAGTLLIEKGDFTRGLHYLEDAKQKFLEFGMTRDAVLCALRLAEAMVSRNDMEAARRVSRGLVPGDLNPLAVQALAQLQQAIDDDVVTTDLIRGVHSYIASLPETSCGIAC